MARTLVTLDPFQIPAQQATGTLPTEFLIFKAGATDTQKGPYIYDAKAAEDVKKAEEDKQRQPWMDYEHQSLSRPPIEAPAAAIFDLDYSAEGLKAVNVKWRPRAARMVAEGEYLFLSPAFIQDTESSRVVELVNIALTNNPATKSLAPLVAHKAELINEPEQEESSMKTVITALGLREEAKEAEALSAVVALNDNARQVLTLTERKTLPEALGVISGWKAAAAEVVELTAKLNEVQASHEEAEFNRILNKATEEGIIPPSADDKRRRFAMRFKGKPEAVASLSAYVESLPPSVLKDSVRPVSPEEGAETNALSADARRIALAMGHDPEKLAKAASSWALNEGVK